MGNTKEVGYVRFAVLRDRAGDGSRPVDVERRNLCLEGISASQCLFTLCLFSNVFWYIRMGADVSLWYHLVI